MSGKKKSNKKKYTKNNANRKGLMVGIAVIFILIISFSVYGMMQAKSGPITNVNTSEAEALIKEGVPVIDVRTAGEYSTGHIPGAKSVPLDILPSEIAKMDKTKPYIVVCLSGSRSLQAANFLVSQSFEQIYNIQGGMMSWKGAEVK